MDAEEGISDVVDFIEIAGERWRHGEVNEDCGFEEEENSDYLDSLINGN